MDELQTQLYLLNDGTHVEFQVSETSVGLARASRNDGTTEVRLDEALRPLAPTINTVLEKLKHINTPDEIEMEFGVTLGGEAGVIFAKLSTEANFVVKVKWQNKPSTESGTDEPSEQGTQT